MPTTAVSLTFDEVDALVGRLPREPVYGRGGQHDNPTRAQARARLGAGPRTGNARGHGPAARRGGSI